MIFIEYFLAPDWPSQLGINDVEAERRGLEEKAVLLLGVIVSYSHLRAYHIIFTPPSLSLLFLPESKEETSVYPRGHVLQELKKSKIHFLTLSFKPRLKTLLKKSNNL